MEHVSVLFSLLFFAVFAAYLFFCIYIIRLNPKSPVNRTFFAICIALCLWSFGFSMANSARDAETCLFWRRFCALGWASLHSIMLHFLMTLTGKGRLLKKWWIYPLLYLPAVINVYVFALSNRLAAVQYSLVRTPYGWVNMSVNNGWDLLYYAYYAASAVGCVWLLVRWKLKNPGSRGVRVQANLILAALLCTYVLGSLTDVVYNAFAEKPLPQMAPVITMITIMAIYHSIKRFGMMKRESLSGEETILTDETRTRLYRYLSSAYVIVGLLSFVAQYLPQMAGGAEEAGSYFYAGGFFLLIGVVLRLIGRVRQEDLKYSLNIAAVILSIPTASLLFPGNHILWVFPFVLIVISLVFNHRTFLTAIAASSVLTQAVVLIYLRQTGGTYSVYEYVMRMGIYLVAAWLGYSVNRIYVSKLREISYQAGYQRMISEISFDFVGINRTNMEEKIGGLLRQVGDFFEADNAYLYVFPINGKREGPYEWNRREKRAWIKDPGIDGEGALPWWTEQIGRSRSVCIRDASHLPSQAERERELFARHGVRSLLSVPIKVEGEIVGFFGIDSIRHTHQWDDAHGKMLGIIANVLATGFIKLNADREIEFMAYYDHLTRLPHRTLFTDRTRQAVALAQRTEKLIGVMFIDLDSFKAVNDTLGHKSGDELLREVARAFTSRLRASDTVARFGGDEFLIMINNISEARDLETVAGSVMSIFKKPFRLEGKDFYVTASAGLAVYPVDGEDVDTLVKNADIAMYRAKSLGKNQHVFCTPDLKAEVHRNMRLTNDLYHAQERGELMLYYQPQVNLQTNQVTGLEALLRWNHPQLGMISPGIFIDLAEKNGLIGEIGEWVLRQACRQNRRWQDRGYQKLRIAVNVSVYQFQNPLLVESIEEILQETGLSPEHLELEITESIAIKGSDDIAETLLRLKMLGIHISIDDFGTEYSSLSRLKNLPVDRIKIDMQFIQGMDTNEKDKEITKVIIYLAKSLGLKVLAEGVETPSQLEFLNQKMCDEVQGFYYYKPMPADQVEELLKRYAF